MPTEKRSAAVTPTLAAIASAALFSSAAITAGQIDLLEKAATALGPMGLALVTYHWHSERRHEDKDDRIRSLEGALKVANDKRAEHENDMRVIFERMGALAEAKSRRQGESET